ncbi:MAG: SRPBCC family protein [Bacteroidia bacterium]
MKYTNEVIINLPRERVVELFDNPDNLKHWQPGLKSFEHISGEAGKPGAKSQIKYEMGKRKIEMVETIIKRDLPDEFSAVYETKGVWNEQRNLFIPIGPDKTRYLSEAEFRFSGFMKLIGWLMPGAFKKQSQKYLDDFKTFAESQGNAAG